LIVVGDEVVELFVENVAQCGRLHQIGVVAGADGICGQGLCSGIGH